jgi:GNAT superfamily N-acetyltransferase
VAQKIIDMIFREAAISDIPQIQIVRNAVQENRLSNPALVTDKDCEEFMCVRGKGWVCQIENTIVGFAIADLKENNIWALFVSPEHEGKKIGKQLQTLMLNWYFNQTQEKVWLGTAPHTRAEKFYTQSGWKNAGNVNKGEVKFIMTAEDWASIKKLNRKQEE